MTQWKALINEAIAAAKTPAEKNRVDWFVRGIWKPMEKGAADHAAVVPSLRAFSLNNGLSLRPGLGLRWTF